MNAKKIRTEITPLVLAEPAAAAVLNESHQKRRMDRYADEKRIARGEPIKGPPWIRDGKRVKYRWSDLQDYVAALPVFPHGMAD